MHINMNYYLYAQIYLYDLPWEHIQDILYFILIEITC